MRPSAQDFALLRLDRVKAASVLVDTAPLLVHPPAAPSPHREHDGDDQPGGVSRGRSRIVSGELSIPFRSPGSNRGASGQMTFVAIARC